ncbi:uncharacterized protein ANIA_11671 [Aspergillus nidulans FGSC A4]|uniref:Uncharacterized protein n=1 Tax=Emericella nidulans (strain FGSC A4 / ATCC 38163 / CBS 112.46 / NRRL 194 / M139) TaxID=227321 RepID=C8VKN8_EMENI|nr:hypothetical protein [Aspergillus nidulans FGSC A4]CBF84372.1 TPA: hypothetical protein ANIA_11671 [Aspergillus nidulans FGSC A4]
MKVLTIVATTVIAGVTGIRDLLAEIIGMVMTGGHIGLISGIIGVAAEIVKYEWE